MINLAQFSGGKDSTALLLWMKDQGIEFTAVFCDTGWEHPLTYAYIEEINQLLLDGKLVILHGDRDFLDLAQSRQMFPNRRIRFCTQQLKIEPLHRYIASLSDDVTSFTGERAAESLDRSRKYRREWVDDANGYWIERPIFDWSAEDVFAIAKRRGIAPNPLYLMGASRVGCYPCINSNQRDVKAYMKMPGFQERLLGAEARINLGRTKDDWRSFFPMRFIPDWACSATRLRNRDGAILRVPTVEDVFRYLEPLDADQLPLIEAPKCMSVYNLCE